MAVDLNPPVAPTESGKGRFLGIPDDYTVTRRKIPDEFQSTAFDGNVSDKPMIVQTKDPNTMPHYAWGNGERVYQVGDEFKPGQGTDGNSIAELQSQLMQAGLIKKGTKFILGRWDEPSRDAYKKLLEYANGQGSTDEEAMQELLSGTMIDPDDESSRAPLQYTLPDTEDLKAALDKTSMSVLGRKLDAGSLDRIAGSYISELKAVQEGNYYGGVQTEMPSEVQTEMPSASTFAENSIRQQNPSESKSHDYAGAYNEFSSLLKDSQANVKQF